MSVYAHNEKGRQALVAAGLVGERVLCPECAQGKAVNCASQALHPGSDELVACGSPR